MDRSSFVNDTVTLIPAAQIDEHDAPSAHEAGGQTP